MFVQKICMFKVDEIDYSIPFFLFITSIMS